MALPWLFYLQKPTNMQTVATPSSLEVSSFKAPNYAKKATFGASQAGDLKAAAEARKNQIAGWHLLNLRQDFSDAAFMRGHIKAAGLRSPNYMEPATPSRLRAFLKRAKVTPVEALESLGTTLAGYLKLNPLLPLWAALALVLEATGKPSSFQPHTTH